MKKAQTTNSPDLLQKSCKDSNKYLILQLSLCSYFLTYTYENITANIKALYFAGGKYVSKQLNTMCGFNDIRMAILIIRTNATNLREIRMNDRCVIYRYQFYNNQLN